VSHIDDRTSCEGIVWVFFCLFLLKTSSTSIIIPSIASTTTIITSSVVIAAIEVILCVVICTHLAVVFTEVIFRITRFLISSTIGVIVVQCGLGGIVVDWELGVAVAITFSETDAFRRTEPGTGGFGGCA